MAEALLQLTGFCANVRFKGIQGSNSLIWHAFTFVKQMLKSWSICNRIVPKDWIKLVKGRVWSTMAMEYLVQRRG